MAICDENDNPSLLVNPFEPVNCEPQQSLVKPKDTVKLPLLPSGPNLQLNYNHTAPKSNLPKPKPVKNRFGVVQKNRGQRDPSGDANQKKMNRMKNRQRIAALERELLQETTEKSKIYDEWYNHLVF